MLLKKKRSPKPPYRVPAPVESPKLPGVDVGAAYYGERRGGDFHDFCAVNSRLLFLLLDISGGRDEACGIAAYVQEQFRQGATSLFAATDLNEADALVELSLGLNRAVLSAANGVRQTSAFLGCYDSGLGTVSYSNAGHVPGLLRDGNGITELPATGLPFGLFSHATHDAPTVALSPGAVLVLASRGVIEGHCKGDEFGLEGVKRTLAQTDAPSAQRVCAAVLNEVERFMCAPPVHNDVTALALRRSKA
jgi:serine phosphatase RsbU (regulator of sigma subunit)